jgi:chromosome partitioning protein
MRTRDTISRELKLAAPGLGVGVAQGVIRDLQADRDAAQQGTVVTRMGKKTRGPAAEIDALFTEILATHLKRPSPADVISRRVENG